MSALAVQIEPRNSDAGGEAAEGLLELTILMPCLNEAETLAVCVDKARGFLERSGVKGEVLIADNGSTDGSQAIAEAHGARVVPVPARGYGAALIGGIAAARSRFIVMGDADDSYDFENLGPMIEKLRAGADLVMGNRFKGGIAPGAMPPLHKYLGNPVLSFIGRLFYKIPVGDFHCGLRGFSRESILNLKLSSTGMEFASEMVVKAALHRLRIEEVPTTLKPDGRSRPPHLKTWRDGWRHLRFLLLHSPKWLFAYPGAILVLLGLVGCGFLSQGAVRLGDVELSVHTLVVSCFSILIGTQLLSFAILARRYAVNEGFLPPPSNFKSVVAGMSLEWALRLAGVVLVLGLIGSGWAVSTWAGTGFGPLGYDALMRVLVPSLTAVTAAVQFGASAFLASLFTLRR